MCLSDPVNPIRFDFQHMKYGGKVMDKCGFCKMGKDTGGTFAFGEKWEGGAVAVKVSSKGMTQLSTCEREAVALVVILVGRL